MKEYIFELLRNGIWVFPIKGNGKTIEEAKRPLSFRQGDELITWKHPDILSYAEELARKGHHAWAVWLLKSRRFGIDIDMYKAREDLKHDIVEALMNTPEVYSELSARGGIHIILTVNDDKKYKLIAERNWIEYKHDGYFIIAPSILKTPGASYIYKKIAGNILETASIEEWDFFKELILPEIETKIVEDTSITSSPSVNSVKIEGLGLDLDNLTDRQITALLYLLFKYSNCPGMAELMRYIYRTGTVPVRKEMYNIMRIPRTTRWIVQYIITAVLGYLGTSADRVYQYLFSFKFIDEDEEPRSDSPKNAIYNVFSRHDLLLVPRGACPICPLLLNKEACNETPIHKVFRMRPSRVKELIEFVRENVKK